MNASAVLTCPTPLLAAHVLGQPLDPMWSALDCAERELRQDHVVAAAIHEVLGDGCSQRQVLVRLNGRFPVARVKQALQVGTRAGRLRKVIGPRRAHLYSRTST